jgi:membrane-associated phospholipid phosphatase
MYGRASDVFGAMPSLHVAYPLLVLIEGWPLMRTPWRLASVTFFLWMCFAAVYLDHHWALDVLAGVVYCLGVVAAARAIARLLSSIRKARPHAIHPGTLEQRVDAAVTRPAASAADSGKL